MSDDQLVGIADELFQTLDAEESNGDDADAVIAYYLRNRDEVRTYVTQRAEEAESLRANIEAGRPRVSREELLSRRSAKQKADAPTGK